MALTVVPGGTYGKAWGFNAAAFATAALLPCCLAGTDAKPNLAGGFRIAQGTDPEPAQSPKRCRAMPTNTMIDSDRDSMGYIMHGFGIVHEMQNTHATYTVSISTLCKCRGCRCLQVR